MKPLPLGTYLAFAFGGSALTFSITAAMTHDPVASAAVGIGFAVLWKVLVRYYE